MGDIRPELHEKPTRYGGSSSSDDTDDQRVGIHEGQGTAATGPFRISPAAEVRHNPSSRDMSIPVEQESDIRTARIASQNICGETNGLLRSLPMLDNPRPPSRQKASGKKENARLLAGSRVNDVDYNSIPDHSPPVSTLPWGNPHILQVDWRGKPSLDVFKDPDRHLLHQAELELVKTLNMSCAKYLCTKRRIFQACLKTLQAGKEFRRRDAQKACRIDAHKTNKLCGAFEKVGWFDRKYFLGYIKDRNNPLSHEQKLSATSSSGLTKPNIWDVSESEFSFSSEGDEDSTDDDTADSSVSFDGRHDQTKKRTRLNSYQESLLWQQNRGLSLTEGNGSQRRGLNDGLGQAHDTGSSDEAVDEGPLIDDGRSRRGVNIAKTSAEAEAEMNKELANFTYVKPWTVDEVMRSFPFLTDRAAIEKALQDYKGNVDNVVSSLMPVSSQSSGGNSSIERDAESDEEMDQKPTKKQNRRPSRPQPLGLLRETLYPETSEGLPRDDTEEVPMLETRRMTQKIRLTLNNHPGDKSNKFSTTESKSSQQESSMNKPHRRVAVPHSLDEANAADTMLVKMKEKGRS